MTNRDSLPSRADKRCPAPLGGILDRLKVLHFCLQEDGDQIFHFLCSDERSHGLAARMKVFGQVDSRASVEFALSIHGARLPEKGCYSTLS